MKLPVILTKVKAIFAAFILSGIAGSAAYFADINWADFGSFGPMVGLGLGSLIGYAKRDKWVESIVRKLEDYRSELDASAPESAPIEPGIGA